MQTVLEPYFTCTVFSNGTVYSARFSVPLMRRGRIEDGIAYFWSVQRCSNRTVRMNSPDLILKFLNHMNGAEWCRICNTVKKTRAYEMAPTCHTASSEQWPCRKWSRGWKSRTLFLRSEMILFWRTFFVRYFPVWSPKSYKCFSLNTLNPYPEILGSSYHRIQGSNFCLWSIVNWRRFLFWAPIGL